MPYFDAGPTTPFIKFNSKSGRWSMRNDGGDEVEIGDPTFAMDLRNVKTGWVQFQEQSAPDWRFDTATSRASQPSEKHKRGFRVLVFSPKNLGPAAHELASNAAGTRRAMASLFERYEAAPESKDMTKVPVVRCTKVTPVKSKNGVNYEPQLDIVSWVARPAEFAAAPEPQPSASPPPRPTPPSGAVEF